MLLLDADARPGRLGRDARRTIVPQSSRRLSGEEDPEDRGLAERDLPDAVRSGYAPFQALLLQRDQFLGSGLLLGLDPPGARRSSMTRGSRRLPTEQLPRLRLEKVFSFGGGHRLALFGDFLTSRTSGTVINRNARVPDRVRPASGRQRRLGLGAVRRADRACGAAAAHAGSALELLALRALSRRPRGSWPRGRFFWCPPECSLRMRTARP